MASRLLSLSDGIYRRMLQIYPSAFRERFAPEMAQVFRSVCRAAYQEAGPSGVLHLWLRVTWDWLYAVISQWSASLNRQRIGTMGENRIDQRDGIRPLSTFEAVLAVLPFLAFGIGSIASRLELFTSAGRPLGLVLLTEPYLVVNWLILAGLAAGLLAGFPRWAYSYLGWALFYVWWWGDMRFYGYSLGWKIWLPLLGVFLAALLVKRSLQPLRAMLAGIWNDWILLSFGIFILFGQTYMLYDENHHPYLLAFIAATTLIVSLGAWGYFRSTSPLRRTLALAGALLLAAILGVVSDATWDYQAYYNLPETAQRFSLVSLIFMAVLGLVMVGNGLLARWRLHRRTQA